MGTRTPYVGGNWKMNTLLESARALGAGVVEGCASIDDVDIAIFPPIIYALPMARVLGRAESRVALGAQNCSPEKSGAFTGEISVDQLRDSGVTTCLAGHSERRHVMGEDDQLICRKVHAVLDGGLTCLLCVGETLDQRERGQTDAINEAQLRAGLAGVDPNALDRLVIAYEPVWAIGTGKTASPQDAQSAHARCRSILADLFGSENANALRIVYGGSVKPSNARELFAQRDIDGGLIGGASLNADDFTSITRLARG